MTDSTTPLDGLRPHRLTTFGALSLAGPDGDVVLGEHGHHRRRLALLAVLAASGDRGRSRDQLLPLFWREATQSRARHSLDQLLYALRSSIGDSLFAGANPVRLDPGVMSSDVGDFNAAVERGDARAAVEAYRGPFLDGFFLSDAPEFERWVESERSRFATSYASALERLARNADAAGEHDAATRWWGVLTDVDPLSSRYAAGRIRALAAAGEHAAALQFARRYEARVAQELETRVDPAITKLVNGVRTSAHVELAPPLGVSVHATPPVLPDDAASSPAPTQRDHTPALESFGGVAAPRRSVNRRRSAVYAIAALLVVTLPAAMVWRSRIGESGVGAVGHALDLRPAAGAPARIQRRPTRSIAAYELALRGSDPALLRSDSGARRGLEHFQQAVALDSTYAAAWAGLASMHLRVGSTNDTMMSRRVHLALAERAALRAIALDDSLADAHASLALVRKNTLDMASADAELRRAIALDPRNARLHEYMAQRYIVMKRPDLALAEARRAVALDPLSPTATAEVAHALQASDRCDEALVQLAPLRSVRPPLLRVSAIGARCYVRKRMWPEAIVEAQRNLGPTGTRGLPLLGFVLARAGRVDETRRILATLLDRAAHDDGSAMDVAAVYAVLGENDQAFAWLERAVEERSFVMDLHEDLMANLESDPRYERFRTMLGIQKQ